MLNRWDEMEPVAIDALIDRLPDAVLVVDGAGVLRAANTTAETRFGWPRSDWLGRSLLELIHPDDLEWAVDSLETVVDKDVGTPIEIRVRSSADWRLVEVIGSVIEHDGDQMIILCVRDLTQRRLWEVAGNDTEMLRTIMQHAPSLTLLTDELGVVQSVSAALIRLTGRGPEHAVGRNLAELVVPGDRAVLAAALRDVTESQYGRTTLEVILAASDRQAVPCQLSMVNLTSDPTVRGVVISGHDISELREARQELEHLAGHDSLTGLPNRSQLTRVLRRWLDDLDEERDRIVVAFIDLDRFKPVNDLYGHENHANRPR